MSWLRSALVVFSAASVVVSQVANILPEGSVRTYVTVFGAFLGGLAVNAEPLLSAKQADKK